MCRSICERALRAAILAGIVFFARVGVAEPLSALPLLRIDTGRHVAFIHALALDESTGRVFSASEDKTVRVWRIADGRLLETFRVPIGARAEGQLYALALSPDHALLAVGGWTCWDSEGSACVYLLDAASGELLGRIRGLPEVIAALRFSPDGSHLAVGLMGRAGLRVYRMADRTLVASDAAYRDKLLELDFTPDGRLVAAALDGFVRLYDRRFALSGRVNAGLAGRQPFGLRCSPDGRLVAVGFNDVARVSLLSALDLHPISALEVDAASAPRNLTRLAWSSDGSSVYATGEPGAQEAAVIVRWRAPDFAHGERIPATRGRIGDLAITHDARVVFASDEPSLGVLDPDGRVRYRLLSGVPELDTGSDLKVADDGSELEIALAPGGRGRRRFSVQRGTLTPVASPSPDLSSALTASAGWRVTRWQQPGGPLVNGQRIALEPYEEAHVFAIARRAQALLLGTEWSLRAIDERGAERWRVRTSTAVRAVNATADGRFALAALADGTIHWYRLADGTPALTLFLHADGENWVAWTPSGYYASSPYGDTLVGWHVNRGPDRSPDFFRAVQFERELYRPDLIAGNLRGTKSAAAGDDEGRLLLEVSPPRIRIVSTASSAGTGTARVRIMAESTGLPMRDMVVYLNDIPLTPARERLLGRAEAVRFVREIDLPLLAPENDLRIEVFNGRSLGVEERLVTGTPVAVPSRRSRGDLYLLAVGANEFPALDHGLFLSYAASDAAEFARALEGQTGGFRHVHARILRDGAELPVRSAVLAALEQLKQATGEDTVVVFLASHGVSDAAGNYFFVPRDARRADIDALLQGRALASDSSLIGWLAFFDALRNTAGRRLLIVDTCQAHDISGRVREFSLLKRSASSHIGFILASKGDEESQEYSPGRHGLFTYALLQGLQGAADADHDGGTTVGEWFQYAAGLVEQLRDRRIGPQTPQFLAPPVLQMMEIARTPAMTIPAPRS